MAEDTTQKVIILQKDLPEISKDEKYIFRYRIKHKTDFVYSDWSQQYSVSQSNPNYLISALVAANPIKYSLVQFGELGEIQSNNGKITLSWSMPETIKINKFDLYFKWYEGAQPNSGTRNATSWTRYSNVVDGTSIDIKINNNADWVEIAVMAASFPKFEGTNIDSEPVLLFKTNLTQIPIPLDGGDLGA